VPRQAHALGNVLLEHEPKAASLLEPVDLRLQVRAQGGVLDLVKQDVEFASDHSVRFRIGFSIDTGGTESLGAATTFAFPAG
jgi:hypothetical protein